MQLDDEKAAMKLGALTYQGSPNKYQPFAVSNYNMGGDPAPGKAKTLTIHSIYPNWTQPALENQQVNVDMATVGMVMYGPTNFYAANPMWFTNRLYPDSHAGDANNTDTNKLPLKYEVPGGNLKFLDVTNVARPNGTKGTMSFHVDNNLVCDPDHGKFRAFFSFVYVIVLVPDSFFFSLSQLYCIGSGKAISITSYVPIVGDFFNEGFTRCAIYCPANGVWYIKGNQGQPDINFQLGGPQFVPLVADIFNEGQFRCIVVNQADGNWCCKAPGQQGWTGGWNGVGDKSAQKNCDICFNHGQPGDIPLAHNIFGDGEFVSTNLDSSLY